jgi:hypothetical protein
MKTNLRYLRYLRSSAAKTYPATDALRVDSEIILATTISGSTQGPGCAKPRIRP